MPRPPGEAVAEVAESQKQKFTPGLDLPCVDLTGFVGRTEIAKRSKKARLPQAASRVWYQLLKL